MYPLSVIFFGHSNLNIVLSSFVLCMCMIYCRGVQPMAHAPNVAHCMIRNGALHPCDENK